MLEKIFAWLYFPCPTFRVCSCNSTSNTCHQEALSFTTSFHNGTIPGGDHIQVLMSAKIFLRSIVEVMYYMIRFIMIFYNVLIVYSVAMAAILLVGSHLTGTTNTTTVVERYAAVCIAPNTVYTQLLDLPNEARTWPTRWPNFSEVLNAISTSILDGVFVAKTSLFEREIK
jgi:hypothetical protein